MALAGAVRPVQETMLSEFATSAAAVLGVVDWGTPGAEALDKIEVDLELKDILGNALLVAERIRLTCDAGMTMSLGSGALGTVLSGDDTDDMIIECDVGTGKFSLECACAGAGTFTVVAGATQGSGILSCRESLDLTFAGE